MSVGWTFSTFPTSSTSKPMFHQKINDLRNAGFGLWFALSLSKGKRTDSRAWAHWRGEASCWVNFETCIPTQSSLRSQRLFSLTRPEENSMLKISFSETPAEERWVLHGWLTDPWVHELRTCWRKNHRPHVGRACVVDLNEVTFIDKSGERLLCKLAKEGAQFTASGTYTKHILEHLNILRKRNSWNLLGFL